MKILLVGYGWAGKTYHRVISSLYPDVDISIVDIDQEKIYDLGGLEANFCSTDIHRTLAIANFDAAFVLVNTPFHKDVIEILIKEGIKNIFVEKPIVMDMEQARYIEELAGKFNVSIFTAYLINSSEAVACIVDLMEREGLVLREMRGVWGKNRTRDTRMTAGDLEDEMTHMLGLAVFLSNINQRVLELSSQGRVSRLPYVNAEAQQKAYRQDESVPLHPTSSATVNIEVSTDNGKFMIALLSSYLSVKQVRHVELALSSKNPTDQLQYLVSLDFDTESGDVVTLVESGVNGKSSVSTFPSMGKMEREIRAFLQNAISKKDCHFLTGLGESIELLRINHEISG